MGVMINVSFSPNPKGSDQRPGMTTKAVTHKFCSPGQGLPMKRRLGHEVPATQICAEAQESQNKCHLIKVRQNPKHLLITTCLLKHKTDRWVLINT